MGVFPEASGQEDLDSILERERKKTWYIPPQEDNTMIERDSHKLLEELRCKEEMAKRAFRCAGISSAVVAFIAVPYATGNITNHINYASTYYNKEKLFESRGQPYSALAPVYQKAGYEEAMIAGKLGVLPVIGILMAVATRGILNKWEKYKSQLHAALVARDWYQYNTAEPRNR